MTVSGPQETRRARVLVAGRVQGVFFRHATARQANDRGLTGWVRNLPDGDVEAVFEGPAEAVEELVAWCRRGPPAAEVSSVEVSWHDPVGESGFSVR